MNPALRRVLTCTPFLRRVYNGAREHYRNREALRLARRYFVNYADYRKALLNTYPGNSLELRAKNGLRVAIRPTRSDAVLLCEVLMTRSYARYLPSGTYRTVVDIGGYIGDFALFAVADLKASKVIMCEPSPGNCALARMNIAGNQLDDRVSLVEKAVTKDGAPLMLDVDSVTQYRVSAFGTAKTARTLVPSTTLPQIIADFKLADIDLLKVDCEGGEYDIFESLPVHYFAVIHNIVFEFHPIEGYGPRLAAVKERLRQQGYVLRNSGDLIWATRQ